MKRINSVSILTLQTLCVVWLGTLGCSSSNTPAVTAAGGSPAATTGGGTSTTAGGSTSAAAGGSTSSSGTGGAATAGGSTAAGVGGSTGTGTLGSPLCGTLVDGTTAIAKNVNCTAADTQFCYKKCGPLSSGFKTETCSPVAATPGTFAYAEQSGTVTCSFAVGPSYSCYKIPTSYDPTCPTTAPTAGQPCTQAACVVCGPNYFDTGNASHVGYCVCNASATSPTWSCASTPAWPCPAGAGCT